MTLAKKVAELEGRFAALKGGKQPPFGITYDSTTGADPCEDIAAYLEQWARKPMVLRLTTWDDYPPEKRLVLPDDFLEIPKPVPPDEHLRRMQEDARQAEQNGQRQQRPISLG